MILTIQEQGHAHIGHQSHTCIVLMQESDPVEGPKLLADNKDWIRLVQCFTRPNPMLRPSAEEAVTLLQQFLNDHQPEAAAHAC